ncbi:MAG: WzyE family oligosaccharide polymerase [Candidatus Malihini olakiniferum]
MTYLIVGGTRANIIIAFALFFVYWYPTQLDHPMDAGCGRDGWYHGYVLASTKTL